MTDNAKTFSPATFPLSASEPGSISDAWRTHRRTADTIFRGALAVTLAITAIWLFFVVTERDGGAIFNGYRVSSEAIGRVLIGFTVAYVLWGWLWYGIKVLLLRRFVGLTKEDVRVVFTSRMSVPFDLAGLLQRYSERRIRIADMVGRRGRFLTIGMLGFWYNYSAVSRDPKPSFLASGLQDNLFDAIAFNWMMLAIYYSNGFLGRVAYGTDDFTMASANALICWAFGLIVYQA